MVKYHGHTRGQPVWLVNVKGKKRLYTGSEASARKLANALLVTAMTENPLCRAKGGSAVVSVSMGDIRVIRRRKV